MSIRIGLQCSWLAVWFGALCAAGGADAAQRGGDQAEALELGRRIFMHDFSLPGRWDSPVKLGDGGDGLGPVFNDVSCVACHRDGGVGGSGPASKNALLLSLIPPDTREERVLKPLLVEAREVHPLLSATRTTVPLHRFGLPREGDREGYEQYLARAFDHFEGAPDDIVPVQGTIGQGRYELAQRNTIALWGAGLIEELRQKNGNGIRRHLMETQQRKYPWLAGRAPRDSMQREGWFGWRGQAESLSMFNRGACATEMGLTVPGATEDASPVATTTVANPRLDLTNSQVQALNMFVAALPRPVQQIPENPAAAARIARGEEIFNRCQCNACHCRDLGFIEQIYSDLLLHDMGPSLCDAFKANAEIMPGEVVPGFGKGGNYFAPPEQNILNPPKVKPCRCECEWRTPPLWGCADSAPYLHDGRAATLDEAIRLHGGEAELSRRAYLQLPPDESGRLLEFLESLRGPQAEVVDPAPRLASLPQTGRPPSQPTSTRTSPATAVPAVLTEPSVDRADRPVAAPLHDADSAADAGEPQVLGGPLDIPLGLPVTVVSAAEYAVLAELLLELDPTAANRNRARLLRDRLQSSAALRPSAEYALGLFEWRAMLRKEALETFRSASLLSGPAAWQAHRVLIREDLRLKRYKAAAAGLEQSVAAVAASDATLRDRAAEAEWIGVILAWIRGPSGVTAARDEANAVIERLQSSLPPELAAGFALGLDKVERELARLDSDRSEQLTGAAARRQEEQEALSRREQELAQQQTELEGQQLQLQKQVEEEVRKLNVELAELEQQYIEHEGVDARLTNMLTPLQLRMQTLLLSNATERRTLIAVQRELQTLSPQVQQLTERREQNRTAARKVAQQAQQLVQQRQTLVQRLAQSNSAAAAQLQDISKWQDRVSKQAAGIEASPAEQSSRIRRYDRAARELATYDRFDAVEEARLLLARFQPDAP